MAYDNLAQRRVRIYGDCISMDKIRKMENKIYSVVTHPGKAEFVNVILDALDRYQQGVCDLHIGMHMLVLIYKNLLSWIVTSGASSFY